MWWSLVKLASQKDHPLGFPFPDIHSLTAGFLLYVLPLICPQDYPIATSYFMTLKPISKRHPFQAQRNQADKPCERPLPPTEQSTNAGIGFRACRPRVRRWPCWGSLYSLSAALWTLLCSAWTGLAFNRNSHVRSTPCRNPSCLTGGRFV